jgi:hypothetical protein
LFSQYGVAIVSQNGGAKKYHTSNSLKRLGANLDFASPAFTAFRIEEILADDDVSPG